MKKWIISAVAVAAVVFAAGAIGMGVSHTSASAATTPHTAAMKASSAGCTGITGNTPAAKLMRELHSGHAQDMQAWQEKYGGDPKSPEAQAALTAMHNEHVGEMRAAFKQRGIKLPDGVCSGSAADMADMHQMMDDTGQTGNTHASHHGGATTDGGSDMPMMD